MRKIRSKTANQKKSIANHANCMITLISKALKAKTTASSINASAPANALIVKKPTKMISGTIIAPEFKTVHQKSPEYARYRVIFS